MSSIFKKSRCPCLNTFLKLVFYFNRFLAPFFSSTSLLVIVEILFI